MIELNITNAVEMLCNGELDTNQQKPLGIIIRTMLRKHNKYAWHNLKENPKDLPAIRHRVLVCDYYGKYFITSLRKVWSNGNTTWGTYTKTITAWKEIEPFEEEE